MPDELAKQNPYIFFGMLDDLGDTTEEDNKLKQRFKTFYGL